MAINRAQNGEHSSQLIDKRIREVGGWRGETLATVRKLILEAVPDMTEELKWRGTPVWSLNGIVCTGEGYGKTVKLTFAKGAQIPDPAQLFNSSLDGNSRRAIDIREGESLDALAFHQLVRSAVELNMSKSTIGRKRKQFSNQQEGDAPVLLSGGNPRIAKGDGDAPVQAYIAAMPGWKREVGLRLDSLIVRIVPDVRKAVKWNSPFYGREGQGWFLSFHVFTRYIKVTFFQGLSITPIPPGGTCKEARWIDIHEGEWDEEQLSSWVTQAANIPGWIP